MTKEEFDIITNKIGCWFTHLKLNSFRKTFDGEIYPSSALGTDYDLFIHKLEKELSFEDKPSLPSNLDEASENCTYCEHAYARESFKEGAEWMAKQGQTFTTIVGETGLFFPPDFDWRKLPFEKGDIIEVTLRKK